MQTYQARLVKKASFFGDIDLLRFQLDSSQQIIFVPGQYIIVNIPHEGQIAKRLYSVASASSSTSSFELLIKRLPGGLASNYIKELQEGQKIDITGPAGLFTLKNTPLDKVFLATGTGIAPVRSFILSHQPHIQHYYLFWGLPTFHEVFLFDELKKLSLQDPLLHITICLSREQNLEAISQTDRRFFKLGHIDEAVNKLLASQPPNSLEYYICCRREIVEITRQYLYNQNVDRSLVFFERY